MPGARRHLLLVLFALLVAACAGRPVETVSRPRTSTPRQLPPDPVPREEPRSRYGNGPTYEVFGREYRVLESSYGYVERGVASWYGRKFHGRLTSSREPYDMYQMTAAHKSLPIPSYVEVRNLANNRRIVVRVNDRGPFVKNRLIDLSYAAATRLGIIKEGTGMVEVRAISFDDPPVRAAVPPIELDADSPIAPSTPTESTATDDTGTKIFVQVGAFGDKNNADRRHRLLADNGISPAFVHREGDRNPALYRVRIGPLAGVDQYDRVIDELSRIGITNSHLVTE